MLLLKSYTQLFSKQLTLINQLIHRGVRNFENEQIK